MSNQIRVLVVDDSAFMCKIISDILSEHPQMEVIGTARNGKDAVMKTLKLKPDVITLDVEMPIMDGLEALKIIMKDCPTPVVMLSSTTIDGAKTTMLAMEHGAIDFVAKPGGAISLNIYEIKDVIINKVKGAAAVQLAKLNRRPRSIDRLSQARPTNRPEPLMEKITSSTKEMESSQQNIRNQFKSGKTFVMIGTSTGGPRALQTVLTELPAALPAPVLIVQHMPAGFTKSLADRLDGLCEIQVKEAEDGELLKNGTAYIAPGGHHLTMIKSGTNYLAQVSKQQEPRFGHRPSVDVLLESAVELSNENFLTVIMTGMGYDGREGMKKLREVGSVFTIAESAETAVVYGMPKAIVDNNLADRVVDLQQIAKTITENLKP